MLGLMHVSLKLFDTTLPVPEYQTEGAAALDLYAREQVVIPARGVGYVPLNIALQLPEGYWALLAARSSLHKRGLMLVNGIGVGDYDYRGDGDEYRAALLNFTDSDVTIERAERIVQLIVLPRERVELQLQTAFDTQNRGGFGTTGKK
jgi:dUTP pyrophosphatase